MKDERKRILKMVEDGKLTVDEALLLMEELDKTSKTVEEKQQELIQELSTAVHFEEAKKEEPFNYKFQSAKDKIIDFVDSALKKIKDFDLDLNFGKSVEISHIFQHADVYMRDIDIDVANGAVKVLPWDQKDVRIECQAKIFRVETQEEARSQFLKDVILTIEGPKLRFATQQKWMKLEAVIYIPQTEYENVKIRMFNGSIESKGLMIESYKAKTANGKITFQDIRSKYVEVETANGQITIQKSMIDNLEAETLNGAITVDGDYRKIDLQSFNGDVFCAVSGDRCEFLETKAATGGIELQLPHYVAVNGELKTNLGGFNVELDGIQILEEKSEVIQKVLRFKSVKDADKGLRLIADTKTGTIHVGKGKSVSF
ncbi:DUF4097 family beta strand repeat protein [Bacillus sp. FJAT-29790]|uniref:DUF4097 family beta strand repeat-containing protein n=1 Tax=Bacillus sp. FJAT-29790 TaxID=1895002 RepID=UPI001C214FC5|nr:DUF4097 domain-containing protein [Bacillus sp. FJAT-29790]MBU8880942.1 DUF4097 family beta strand repeat protein [Bacillus sp. FJAT-29790]